MESENKCTCKLLCECKQETFFSKIYNDRKKNNTSK